jgi:hypothetical protein
MAFAFLEINVCTLCQIDEILFVTFLLVELKIFQAVPDSRFAVKLTEILVF